MSEQIREQISAFLDGELPDAQTELLLKRLTRDAELRECFGRYALIGEACRGATGARLSHGFALKVNAAIGAEPPLAGGELRLGARSSRLWRHAASGAVAAGVAVVAIFALQQRANTPTLADLSATPAPASHALAKYPARPIAVVAKSDHEALSYTVPTTLSEIPAALPPARLTNYVFAHSEYTSFLDQRGLLSGLISEPDAFAAPAPAPAPAPASAGPTKVSAGSADVPSGP